MRLIRIITAGNTINLNLYTIFLFASQQENQEFIILKLNNLKNIIYFIYFFFSPGYLQVQSFLTLLLSFFFFFSDYMKKIDPILPPAFNTFFNLQLCCIRNQYSVIINRKIQLEKSKYKIIRSKADPFMLQECLQMLAYFNFIQSSHKGKLYSAISYYSNEEKFSGSHTRFCLVKWPQSICDLTISKITKY